ncbi:MAG: proline/glycine betaine ABC transporter permease [Deltaproteobacteria bacterium]|nr:proline/glycine betaine ABC transporter permease [Deltaproteobacteria bacterium]
MKRDRRNSRTFPWGRPAAAFVCLLIGASLLAAVLCGPAWAQQHGVSLFEQIGTQGSLIPAEDWIDQAIDWIALTFADFFDVVRSVINNINRGLLAALMRLPVWGISIGGKAVAIPILGLLMVPYLWWASTKWTGIYGFVSLWLIANLGLWEATMETLSLTLTAALIALAIGIPTGILSGKSDIVEAVVRPILDFMQTLPVFVYLIPAVILFGLGAAPGVVATVIFAIPPAVRLTSLGIRGVPKELVEAGEAFGCNYWQLLFKVQLPMARPSIMAGVNQTIMLSLSMVVIAALIGSGGLGGEVVRSIQRMLVGKGFVAGLAVVFIAIILDRATRSVGEKKM